MHLRKWTRCLKGPKTVSGTDLQDVSRVWNLNVTEAACH